MNKLYWFPERFIEHTKEVARGKLEQAGEIIGNEAYRICPVDTGDLADSIDYNLIDEDTVRIGASGSSKRNYAIYVELGTYKTRQQSFLRKGLDNCRRELKRLFTK
jgi:HK97 gp10 family phage protein